MLNKRLVRRGLDGDALLYKPVKKFSTVPGRPPIEPESELVEVVVQVSAGNGALMGPEEPPFEE